MGGGGDLSFMTQSETQSIQPESLTRGLALSILLPNATPDGRIAPDERRQEADTLQITPDSPAKARPHFVKS